MTSPQPVATQSIQVCLVMDPGLLRAALAALLAAEDDLHVVAGIGLNDRAVPTIVRYRPAVAILDVESGGPDMIAVATALRDRLPSCRLVALVSPRRPGLVLRAVGIPVAGAVDTSATPARLMATIRQVAVGRKVVDPTLSAAALGVDRNPLSPKERAALDLAAGGASAPEIARTLRLTYGTACNYLSRATSKLGARTRLDAIRIATESGWI